MLSVRVMGDPQTAQKNAARDLQAACDSKTPDKDTIHHAIEQAAAAALPAGMKILYCSR